MQSLLDKLELTDENHRMQAARSLLYLMQGMSHISCILSLMGCHEFMHRNVLPLHYIRRTTEKCNAII